MRKSFSEHFLLTEDSNMITINCSGIQVLCYVHQEANLEHLASKMKTDWNFRNEDGVGKS